MIVSYGIQINYIKVPLAVKNNSKSPALLDCHYSLRPDDTELVVKWFLNEDLVYQWIPPNSPQSFGLFDDRLDLNYKSCDDPKCVYRAMYVLNPTTEIAGEYKCHVSTLTDEDFAVKNMTVFGKNIDTLYYIELINLRVNATHWSCHLYWLEDVFWVSFVMIRVLYFCDNNQRMKISLI